jgi:prolyl-tRNA synthetase
MKKDIKSSLLSNIDTDFSQWYQDVIAGAELAESSPVKGCMTILPYGYALWEQIQKKLDVEIKKMGAKNMAFPLFIPYSFFEREKDHVEGFAPEVAIVTHAGGKKLEEPLVVRPTSEVIIHDYFKNKIRSWRDLPLKVNQWCNVVRWEKRPRAFLRTTEFWWQEGHTAHATAEEASLQAEKALFMYRDFVQDILAIPVIAAEKPSYERFAGADKTFTIEGMMRDGKAVQMGTSHILGSGFANVLGMEFQDKDMTNKVPVLTSWGVTTRLIGTIIMVHGDQSGLVLPPAIAPILFILIPIYKNDLEREIVFNKITVLESFFIEFNISFEIDDAPLTPGARFFNAEMRGIPFRIELGMRDAEQNQFTLFERDVKRKAVYNFSEITNKEFFVIFTHLKHTMQERMLEKAKKSRSLRYASGKKLSEFGAQLIDQNGFYETFWCGDEAERFKEYQANIRCVLESGVVDQVCCLHDNCKKLLDKVIVAKCY